MRGFIICLLCVVTIQAFYIDRWLDEHKSEVEARGGNIWVLLVAGSNTWSNYRHQADICHIFHTLTKKHGIPQRYVVTMMYNDIAYNEHNKWPGTIINALEGKNVYEGVVIDYMDKAVNPLNFLAILRGDQYHVENQGSGKVIQSKENDVVFVNFADHGDTGVLAFPYGAGELHKADLMATINEMHEQKKYKQMLWYVEACFSGSMFDVLPPTWNVTAHTAANAHESSYACTLDDELDVYLGDCWSLNWMNNTDQHFPELDITVGEQYKVVKKMTTTSHAMIFGDLKTIYNEKISTFMGHGGHAAASNEEVVSGGRIVLTDPIATQDVLLFTLRRQLAKSTDDLERRLLKSQIEMHERTEVKVQEIINKITEDVVGDAELAFVFKQAPEKVQNMYCNKDVLSTFYKRCYNIQQNPYITKYTFAISNLCNHYVTQDIVQAIRDNCNNNRFEN